MPKQEIHIVPPELVQKGIFAVLAALTLFLLIAALVQFREFQFIGSGVSATNTITVNGEGEEFVVADRAKFTVSVMEEAKDVKVAQDAAKKKMNAIITYLEKEGVAKKDIKTTDYSVYPQYDYVQETCRAGYCLPGKQTLRGFQVTQAIAVKTPDTENAGALLAGVGELKATSVSGLEFTVEDEDQVKIGARDKAIEDARAKAEELAESLGVELVRVVGFSENSGGGYHAPMYAKASNMDMMAVAESAPAIPVGENKITANVSVTYEIR